MPALKSFDEQIGRAQELTRLAPRLLPIEVRRIVGSVSSTKIDGLTKDFLPRKGGSAAPRYRSVCKAMQDDVPLPAIEVYALRGKYYVVDGHHRVAAARALGYLYLDALVHEFLLPVTSAVNRLYNERVHFERLTGLAEIVLTETGAYRKLGNQIREHRFFLGENGKEASLKTAATDWYEYIYLPITELLETSGVLAHFPERTVADLYVYLCDYKWVKSQNKGMDIGFPKALADFERLYGTTTAGRTAPRLGSKVLRTLQPLTAPVMGATRELARVAGGDRRADRLADGHEDTAGLCLLCDSPIEGHDGGGTGTAVVCAECA